MLPLSPILPISKSSFCYNCMYGDTLQTVPSFRSRPQVALIMEFCIFVEPKPKNCTWPNYMAWLSLLPYSILLTSSLSCLRLFAVVGTSVDIDKTLPSVQIPSLKDEFIAFEEVRGLETRAHPRGSATNLSTNAYQS